MRFKHQKTAQRNTKPPGNGASDPFAFIKDRELVDLISQLDGTYDSLMGAALEGNSGSYELAHTVRSATDYLIALRLASAR